MLLSRLAFVLSVLCICNINARPQHHRREDDNVEERRGHRKRRPCRIGGGKGKNAEGRTFFDWNYSYVNVNHNYNYNIDCSGQGGQGFGGGGKPHRPHKHFGGGHTGYYRPPPPPPPPLPPPLPPPVPPPAPPPYYPPPYYPPPNRPFQPFGGIFSLSQSQSQASTSSDTPQPQRPMLGQIVNNGVNMVGEISQSILHVGQGITQGLSEFQFPNFQLPQAPQLPALSEGGTGQGIASFFQNLPLLGGLFNRPSAGPASSPSVPAAPAPANPDDIIYNEEKPVNEDYDPVMPDAYSNFKPGNSYKGQSQYQNRYQAQKNYNNRFSNNDKFLRPESRSLKFPD